MSLKKYMKYRCAAEGCGKASVWTGALSVPERPGDDCCPACGEPYTEVIEDGFTYRVAWEMVGPFDPAWRPQHKDHTDRHEAEDQYRTLAEWERTGAEQVRAVTITRGAEIRFEPYDLPPAPSERGEP